MKMLIYAEFGDKKKKKTSTGSFSFCYDLGAWDYHQLQIYAGLNTNL